ncbi:hypothetical protein M378DRAFT_172537 [Amanita muscaria Koide BX008]|uniref:Uncharacterized protein n=1 Tax=Amanita muscaria (strain Koide BX008) TaxID=946122 RepID=A0A0C2W681_AMAMK|nr:hypothetical protein M378DRAFT_172537 [Amanita muscaria Koide BX008]
MIRFFQQLGCYIDIPLIPSNDILTAENWRVFEEGLDSNTNTHGSHSFRNDTKHSKLASKSVIPQDSSSDTVESQSPPSNSRAGVEQNIGATLQDALHFSAIENTHTASVDQQNVNSQGMEHIGQGFYRHGRDVDLTEF